MYTQNSDLYAQVSNALATTLLPTEPVMDSSTTLMQLRADVVRLQTDNEDLRASAKRWADLYESAMQRAMELEALLAASRDQAMHVEDEIRQ